jgi:hypothetical protein
MDAQALITEIQTDPLSRGYTGMSDAALFASLSALDRTEIVPSPATELTVMDAFAKANGDPAGAETCLDKLTTAASGNPLLARALAWTKPGAPGLDMGNPAVRAMIDSLTAANVITSAEQAILKSIGERKISRLQELNCGDVSESEVSWRRAALGGN